MPILFLALSLIHFAALIAFPENVYLCLFTKVLPILLLIQFAHKNIGTGSSANKLFFWALVFSLGGDTILGLEALNPLLFAPGLGSFLIAQILYSISFSKGSHLHWPKGIPIYLMGFGLFVYLYPSLPGELVLPVFIYMTALTTMAWRANSRNTHPESLRWTGYGALIFLISDALIALSKFKNLPISNPQLFIMITYYAAQYMIVRGIYRHAQKLSN